MYQIFYITEKEKDFYDIKINLSKKDYYINLFNLENKGLHKSFYKNNILIISDNKEINFYKIIEKEIFIEKEYLIIDFEKIIFKPFSLTEIDYSEEYELYENCIDEVTIILKVFKNYCELEFITNNLNKFNKLEK